MTALDQLMQHLPPGWRVRIVPPEEMPTTYAACLYPTRTIYVALGDEWRMLRSLCHEISHAVCPPGAGHGVLWLTTCRELWTEAGLGTTGWDWIVQAHVGR